MARHREIAIIEGGSAHVVLLAELHGRCFDPMWSSLDLARLLAMPGALALIAAEAGAAGEPLGFVLARCAADEAEVLTIGVVGAARRIGIGSRLLAELEPRLADQGARRLFIDVAIGNDAARSFYARLGFADAGRRPDYYRNPDGSREDAILMVRAIRVVASGGAAYR